MSGVSRGWAFTLLICAWTSATLANDEPPTWSDGVAEVVRSRCGTCHRPGGVAPFSLLEYEQARAWSRSIAREVQRRSMPPWHADPAIGVFANDRSLSEEDRHLVVAWAMGGAPEGENPEGEIGATVGGASSVRESEPAQAGEWQIGEPDLVLELPPVTVPPSGEVPYHDYVLETGLEEDVWVQSAEVQPGNPGVVHHVIVEYVVDDPRERARLREKGLEGRVQGSLGGYVPGDGPLVMAEGFGRRLPAGARLYFQVHYTPNGEETIDRTRLGLRLASSPPRHETRTALASSPFIDIPAGEPEVALEAEHRFERDAMLLSMRPHLHLRGKSFEYRAHYPDGTEETLLRIPRWDFDWQTTYHLAEPMFLPAGTRLICRATWDNSAQNPRNPDPTVAVGWGPRTVDEMMIGFFDYYEP